MVTHYCILFVKESRKKNQNNSQIQLENFAAIVVFFFFEVIRPKTEAVFLVSLWK